MPAELPIDAADRLELGLQTSLGLPYETFGIASAHVDQDGEAPTGIFAGDDPGPFDGANIGDLGEGHGRT